MQYFVKRGEQRFGPYNLAELQGYVLSGNILADELTQSEGMDSWMPVSQVLGNIPRTPGMADGSAIAVAPETHLVELPANWHWAIVLVLGALTRNLFNLIWAMIQANWARKLSGDNKPLVLVAMYPAGMVAGILAIAIFHQPAFGGLFILAGMIVYLFGVFSIRSAMEDYYNSTENIGLTLSGVMTFFFSTVYIQYHINRLARWKKTGVLS